MVLVLVQARVRNPTPRHALQNQSRQMYEVHAPPIIGRCFLGRPNQRFCLGAIRDTIF